MPISRHRRHHHLARRGRVHGARLRHGAGLHRGDDLRLPASCKEMISGLADWMDAKGHADLDAIRGRAVPNVTDWQYLNLNYVAKARIDQDLCINCGRCFAACEDTSHQAIAMLPGRVFEVKDDECVACNLCVNVCPVEDCITMVRARSRATLDARTGKVVRARATPTGRRTRTTRWPGRRSSAPPPRTGLSGRFRVGSDDGGIEAKVTAHDTPGDLHGRISPG